MVLFFPEELHSTVPAAQQEFKGSQYFLVLTALIKA